MCVPSPSPRRLFFLLRQPLDSLNHRIFMNEALIHRLGLPSLHMLLLREPLVLASRNSFDYSIWALFALPSISHSAIPFVLLNCTIITIIIECLPCAATRRRADLIVFSFSAKEPVPIMRPPRQDRLMI